MLTKLALLWLMAQPDLYHIHIIKSKLLEVR